MFSDGFGECVINAEGPGLAGICGYLKNRRTVQARCPV